MCDIETIVLVCAVWSVLITFVLWSEETGCIYLPYTLLMLLNLVKVKSLLRNEPFYSHLPCK